MISLGEMIAYLPIPGGHITLAERFVDPAWSFALGWNYCAFGHRLLNKTNDLRFEPVGYSWTITLPTELSAAAVLVGYW